MKLCARIFFVFPVDVCSVASRREFVTATPDCLGSSPDAAAVFARNVEICSYPLHSAMIPLKLLKERGKNRKLPNIS